MVSCTVGSRTLDRDLAQPGWRADRMALFRNLAFPICQAFLAGELPGADRPCSTPLELLVQQPQAAFSRPASLAL